MTHAMTSSALSRLAPLGMLLWLAAASLALPFHTSAGAPYEADGPAAHDLSLRPFGHGAHLDFERRVKQCTADEKYGGEDCCTEWIGGRMGQIEKDPCGSPRRSAPPAARTSRDMPSANLAPRNSPRPSGRPATAAPRVPIARSRGFGGEIADAERGRLMESLDAFFDKGLDAFFAM